jgi:branched-chain amino acid transport system substrate-binding protein
MKKNKQIFLIGLILIILILFVAYKNFFLEDKIKIGFVGGLTGKYSVLGNSMINGLLLAFEEIDYTVLGHQIDVVYRDDKQDSALNKNIINTFLDENRKIIIGNITSQMSKVTLQTIKDRNDVFMISAASASDQFSNKNDQFFRVHVSNNVKRFDKFTQSLIRTGVKKIYGIYDPVNAVYAKDYLTNFEQSFVQNGGNSFLQFAKTNDDLDDLVQDIRDKNPDVILICANSVDSSKVVQYLRLKNIPTQIVASEWAMTQRFIENGGKAVEGVMFNIDFDEFSSAPAYKRFAQIYEKKYHEQPSVFAMKAYELGKILIEGLKQGEVAQLKKNILRQKIFDGLQGKIVFNEYGDVNREYYVIVIRNAQYIRDTNYE